MLLRSKLTKSALLATLALSSATVLSAAIAVEGTDFASGGGSATVNYNLAAGGNVLVVGTYVDTGGGGAAATFSFNTNGASGSFVSDRGAMAYYQTSGSDSTVDIVVTRASANLGIVVWELSGVNSSSPVDSFTGGTNTITTTVPNVFLVGAGFANGAGVDTSLSATGAAYATTDIAPFQFAGAGGGGIGGASGLATTVGTYDISWTNDTSGSAMVYGFAPAAVPEPATLSLLGCAMFALLLRRRR